MTTVPLPVSSMSPEEKRALLQKLLKEKGERSGLFPLSFSQQRLWFLDKLQPGSALYNIPVVLRLKGRLDRAVLRRAVEEVVARHESLRTTFVSREDNPHQKVNPKGTVDFRFVPLLESRGEDPQKLVSEEVRKPFNLAEDPMVRVTLFQLAEEEYILALVYTTSPQMNGRWKFCSASGVSFTKEC